MSDDKLKSIRIQYYAMLREESGKSNEIIHTRAINALELFEELRNLYGFSLTFPMLKVAINGEFVEAKAPLNENDELILIPPVAGG